jgi:hypothetical protein
MIGMRCQERQSLIHGCGERVCLDLQCVVDVILVAQDIAAKKGHFVPMMKWSGLGRTGGARAAQTLTQVNQDAGN